MMALVTSVVPCTTAPRSAKLTPADPSDSRAPRVPGDASSLLRQVMPNPDAMRERAARRPTRPGVRRPACHWPEGDEGRRPSLGRDVSIGYEASTLPDPASAPQPHCHERAMRPQEARSVHAPALRGGGSTLPRSDGLAYATRTLRED